MRTKYIRVSMTIPFPIDSADENGIVYSKEAIEKAIPSFRNAAIVFRDNEESDGKQIVGALDDDYPDVEWDYENGVCNITVKGFAFHGGTECRVNDLHNNTIHSFEVVGVGLSI